MTALAPDLQTLGERSPAEPIVHTRPVDEAAAVAAVGDLLVALGLDPDDAGLADTPRRVARMFAELLTPAPLRPTTFPNDGGYDELVLVSDIPLTALCEHHLLPFRGVAHVGYLPGERIIGLSKLARLVEAFARRRVRGVRANGTRTVTSALYGLLRENPAARQEFLQLARHGT